MRLSFTFFVGLYYKQPAHGSSLRRAVAAVLRSKELQYNHILFKV